MSNPSILNISWGSISKIVAAVIAVYILYTVKNIIVWFIFAVVIAILFNYLIDIFEKKRIPRVASAAFLYLAVFAILSFFIYKTAPLLLNELKDLIENFPGYVQRILPVFERLGIKVESSELLLETLQGHLNKAGSSVINALFSIFGGASSTILVIATAFFISVEHSFIERVLTAFSPSRYKEYLFKLWGRAKKKVSGWFLTRLVGVLFVGAGTYIALTIFDVKYSLILSILAGLFDIVPIIGPIVAGALMGAVVALNSLSQALFVVLVFVIIQLLENNLLFPVLFKKFMGLSPVLVLIALAVGGRLWGISGAILAIPLAGVFFEVLKDYLKKLHEQDGKAARLASADYSAPQLDL